VTSTFQETAITAERTFLYISDTQQESKVFIILLLIKQSTVTASVRQKDDNCKDIQNEINSLQS